MKKEPAVDWISDSFLLRLGEDYDWAPVVDDETIVSRAKNVAAVQGAQGVYDALKVGKTSLSAGGRAHRAGSHRGGSPSRSWYNNGMH